jgi:pimeloyl-ACP methyl ester carboxylesterase
VKKDYYLGLSKEGFHRIAYTEWGSSTTNKRPIICVHGLTRNKHDFDPLAAYLSQQGYHLFCPDIVGRGESSWLKDATSYSFEQYAADMSTLIARTHANDIDWIGTSMGGIIGMMLASMPGTPIRRLILNDIGAQIPIKGLSRLATYVNSNPTFTSLEEAKSYFKKIYAEFGPLTDQDWQRLTENSIRNIGRKQWGLNLDHRITLTPAKSKLLWQCLMNPHKALEGTFFDIDLWHIWHQITCPVLIIHGEQSDILLSSIIKKMQISHTNTDVLSIPQAGHAPALFDSFQHHAIHQWLK